MQEKYFCHFCGERLVKRHYEGRMRPFCRTCDGPIYENPVPATANVVVDQDGRVLLVKRAVAPKAGLWCLPGGFLELSESPEEGALRELEEETGLSGKVDLLLGILSSPSPTYQTVLMIGYLVKDFSGELIAGDDALAAGFFANDQMPEIAFSSHRQFIRLYFAAHAHDIEFAKKKG